MTSTARYLQRCHSSGAYLLGVTKSSTGRISCLVCKHTLLLMAGESMNTKENRQWSFPSISMISICTFQICILIYTDECRSYSSTESFFLQQTESTSESHNWSTCRELTMGCPSPVDTPKTQHLYPECRRQFRRENGNVVRDRRIESLV